MSGQLAAPNLRHEGPAATLVLMDHDTKLGPGYDAAMVAAGITVNVSGQSHQT
jgi:hypothetical protein